jgi:hypothetical protein
MRLPLLPTALAIGIVLLPTAAQSQVRWAETERVYYVTVSDWNGRPQQMRIDPPNKVLIEVELVQIDSGASVIYRYRVRALPTSPQGLARVRIACSAVAHDLEGGDWNSIRQLNGQTYCGFEVNAGIGQPGDVVRFSVPRLAGTTVGALLAQGGTNSPAWPAEAGDPRNEHIKPIVDSLLGRSENGLAARVTSPAPKYDRAIVAQTDAGLEILSHELKTICSTTDWIPSPATCSSLASKLPVVSTARRAESGSQRAALTASERNAIRQQLNAFIAELVAGRGTTVHQNAFTILHVLARAVRAPLIP